MSDVPALLQQLLADPGRPRLTWYGPDAERVELSGKVLLNWVAKTANLLTDELDDFVILVRPRPRAEH